MSSPPIPRTSSSWRSLTQFVRASALGASLELPILGAASAGRPGVGAVVGFVIVAACFHVFAYVLNDVVDLPIDRTEARRSDTPLVRGALTPAAAAAIAVVQIPLALGCAILWGAGPAAVAALLASFAAMACYDVWGKRTALPPVTDLVQGLGWGALTLYGALAMGRPTALSWLVCGFVVVVMVLVNGVHGSLRDLDNDVRCGARTTAIVFGARALPGGGVEVPRGLAGYALALQALLLGCTASAFAVELVTRPRPAAWTLWSSGTALLVLATASCALLVRAAREAGDFWRLRFVGLLHVVVTLALPVVVVAPRLDPVVLALLLLAFLVPSLSDRWLPPAVRWLTATRAGAVGLEGERR